MTSVVIFGGYGTFGKRVARELARLGVPLAIAGRDGARAEALARELGPTNRGITADVSRSDSCLEALRGHRVAVNCAGPFGSLGPALLDSCVEAGCHYADINDDRAYTSLVRSRGPAFAERGLAAVFGCSTLPGISGALAARAQEGTNVVPQRLRVTLFLGNANPKGAAAIQNFVNLLGKPFPAPQGTLRGFRSLEFVRIPGDLGRRPALDVESPEYDLFPERFGVRSVSVKVALELSVATYGFGLLAWLPWHPGRRFSRFVDWVGRHAPALGSTSAAVIVDLFFADGLVRRAILLARNDGQRMGALPCAFAVQELAHSRTPILGPVPAYEFLGAAPLLDRLVAEGSELDVTAV
jgi:hypothetical protein